MLIPEDIGKELTLAVLFCGQFFSASRSYLLEFVEPGNSLTVLVFL
jgi:hypothetical protein